MKILLIFPPNVEVVEPFKSAKRKPPALLWGFPLGLGYLAAVLRKNGFDVSVLDSCIEKMDIDSIMRRIKELKPQVIGIGSLTHLLKSSVELASRIRRFDNGIKIIFGGPHATYDFEKLLRLECIDYIVIGEGEQTFLELCDKIKDNEPVNTVKGIAFKKDDGTVQKTPARPLIEDLDSLPYPARDLLDFTKYIKSYGVLEKSVDILSSRGCTNRCVFCSSSHLFGRWRPRSVENIVSEIKELLRQYPVIKSINFMDDDFTVDKQRVLNFCNTMIAEGLNKLSWVCLARVDQLDEEMVRAMKAAGCVRVHLGIESGSPQILKNINKRISLQQAYESVRILSRAKIEAYSFFMFGHPGETAETVRMTRRFAQSLPSANTGFFVTQIFPGTRLAELQPVDDWVGYLYRPEVQQPSIFTHPCVPNFIPEGFSRESLKRICANVTRQFIFLHFLKRGPLFVKKIITEPKESLRYILQVFFGR
jgi:anaerobic magnesium-protoporphyrin IX monomethyl ester cyclase